MNILVFSLAICFTSILAGFLGALTGLGGGVVIVPVLCIIFKIDLHYAIGASLVSVIATSSGAAAAYVRDGYSNIRVGMFLEVATTLGALLGAYLVAKVSANWIGFVGGLGMIHYGESLLGDIQGTGDLHARSLANWQVHMGSACLGTAAFAIILFLLELLGHKSKIYAWRATWPWLPLVGVIALATRIHFPAYVVIVMCVLDVGWASYKIWATRKASNLGGGRRGSN
jgi:uncharacterized membrane protein YfcA